MYLQEFTLPGEGWEEGYLSPVDNPEMKRIKTCVAGAFHFRIIHRTQIPFLPARAWKCKFLQIHSAAPPPA